MEGHKGGERETTWELVSCFLFGIAFVAHFVGSVFLFGSLMNLTTHSRPHQSGEFGCHPPDFELISSILTAEAAEIEFRYDMTMVPNFSCLGRVFWSGEGRFGWLLRFQRASFGLGFFNFYYFLTFIIYIYIYMSTLPQPNTHQIQLFFVHMLHKVTIS